MAHPHMPGGIYKFYLRHARLLFAGGSLLATSADPISFNTKIAVHGTIR